MEEVTIPVTVTDEEAWAFAQFLKRAGRSDYLRNAQDSNEADKMFSAAEKFRAAFAKAGYAPR